MKKSPEPPKAEHPEVEAVLRKVRGGDVLAIAGLADLLRDRGDHRARKVSAAWEAFARRARYFRTADFRRRRCSRWEAIASWLPALRRPLKKLFGGQRWARLTKKSRSRMALDVLNSPHI